MRCPVVSLCSPRPIVPLGYESTLLPVKLLGHSGATSLEGNIFLAWTNSPDSAADVMARAEAARVYAADAKMRIEHQKAMGIDEGGVPV